ncbi:hypothetical protein E3V93_15670 [Microbacterium sp. 3H14]|nr:hypothetical protein E3V93_15670 [Microbacterium sp. 3H14]
MGRPVSRRGRDGDEGSVEPPARHPASDERAHEAEDHRIALAAAPRPCPDRSPNIPDGGGWRFVGKQQGDWNRQATARRTGQRNSRSEPRLGTAFVHIVLDDHSRVAYAEIHSDEKAVTAIGVVERATTRQLL